MRLHGNSIFKIKNNLKYMRIVFVSVIFKIHQFHNQVPCSRFRTRTNNRPGYRWSMCRHFCIDSKSNRMAILVYLKKKDFLYVFYLNPAEFLSFYYQSHNWCPYIRLDTYTCSHCYYRCHMWLHSGISSRSGRMAKL